MTGSSTPTPHRPSRAPSAVPAATATGSAARTHPTWPAPDTELHTEDRRYGTVHIQAWSGLHPKLAGRGRWTDRDAPPIVTGTVIRVDVNTYPNPPARTEEDAVAVVVGPGPIDLDTCWRAYLRASISSTPSGSARTPSGGPPTTMHPRPGRPVDLAHHRRLHPTPARPTPGRRPAGLPWGETRQTKQLTPVRVRRGFRRLAATLGTPANPPKPSKAGPGRPKGTHRGPRTRHPAIKKTA